MKLSYNWLREWIRPNADAGEVARRLTLAGVETEVEPLPPLPSGIVVGLIRSLRPHPQADRLRVCEVDVGGKKTLTIVCGAANARAGMKAPVALPGVRLPSGLEINKTQLRGVDSAGMLCSAGELGLAEKSDGLLELDPQARPGVTLHKHLALEDSVLAIDFTPNRSDCLGVAGLARELSAIFGIPVHRPPVPAVKGRIRDRVAVNIADAKGCSSYHGRVMTGLDPQARTPDWMREKLRRSGLRCIHPLVDITNFVMLELGQPLHAFDLAQLKGPVQVRRARKGESLRLLNGQTVMLDPADLLIADSARPLALAGVMGSEGSGVGESTTAVFLESACFSPEQLAATGRRHRLQSDALYRFERGVDPQLQREALERATQLILEICGGETGPVNPAAGARPRPVTVRLRKTRLDQLLGHAIAETEIERLLKRLGLGLKRTARGVWQARIPGYRYDLRIEADLIEEVARLYGYERIPVRPYPAELVPAAQPETIRPLSVLRERLAARGYQEVVTYSFVEPTLQRRLLPDAGVIALDNPIAETLAVMRATLWSGLIPAWQFNHQRQMRRVRIFEAAVCYREQAGRVIEDLRLAGLCAGPAAPEQWGVPARPVDYFDVKADLEALFGAELGDYRFEAAGHPALHPGQSARVFRGEREAGWLGVLHPGLVQALDLPEAPVLFELQAAVLTNARLPRPRIPPEFPSSRRDLAVVVSEETPAARLLDEVRAACGPWLGRVHLFDVYRGPGLPNGCKSMALGLIFQDNSSTLTDQQVDSAVQGVVDRLAGALGASIRK